MHTQLFRWVALLLASFSLMTQASEPVSTVWSNVAIGGKDTVSYFTEGAKASHQVLDGQAGFAVQYQGATWRFASRASADKFAANPGAYAPQYNGHCSNGLSLDEGLIPTRGDVWEFFGDKLYLFYAERGRLRWLSGDWRAYRDHADKAWRVIVAARH